MVRLEVEVARVNGGDFAAGSGSGGMKRSKKAWARCRGRSQLIMTGMDLELETVVKRSSGVGGSDGQASGGLGWKRGSGRHTKFTSS